MNAARCKAELAMSTCRLVSTYSYTAGPGIAMGMSLVLFHIHSTIPVQQLEAPICACTVYASLSPPVPGPRSLVLWSSGPQVHQI